MMKFDAFHHMLFQIVLLLAAEPGKSQVANPSSSKSTSLRRSVQSGISITTSATCDSAPVSSSGTKLLLLTEDLTCGDGTALTIDQPDVTLDCQGFVLQRNETTLRPGSSDVYVPGSTTSGFFISGSGILISSTNVTIKDCFVVGFVDGIAVDRSNIGPVVIDNVTSAGNMANGIKSIGADISIANSKLIGNARTGITIWSGSVTIRDSDISQNGGTGVFVNDGGDEVTTATLENVRINNNGMPIVHGQGVGLTVAPETVTTIANSELCANKDGPFRFVLGSNDAVALGTIDTTEAVTCDDGERCDMACSTP